MHLRDGSHARELVVTRGERHNCFMDSVRVDRWLCAARLYKSRDDAQQACVGGHVKVNGAAVKASYAVKVGDEIVALAPRGRVVLEVLFLATKRLSPPKARALYEDRSPPPEPRAPEPLGGFPGERDRGAGRPSKRDRRALIRLRRE